VYTRGIGAALKVLGEEDRFDADFLARLRYDKAGGDSFAGSTDNASTCSRRTHPSARSRST
jgi:hypothetical protein